MSGPHQYRMNETEKEAVADDIKSLGGPKVAAGILAPNKSPARGEDLMRAWCNPSRQEEPSIDEMIQLIDAARQKVGFSEVARYLEHRLNCRIEFLTPEDEQAKLRRDYIAAVDRLASLTERIERNEQRMGLSR